MNRIRVLLVVEHPEFLDAAAHFLAGYADIELVGAMNSPSEALGRISEFLPDLVLMELRMKAMSGLRAALQVKAMEQPPKVVLITDHSEPAYRDLATAVEVDGLVPRRSFCRDVVPTIKRLFGSSAETEPVRRANGNEESVEFCI